MSALVAAGAGGYGLPKSTSVSVSVATLLTGLVSVSPAGRDTVTVLVSVPVSIPITPLSAMDTLWPLAKFSPLQDRVSQDETADRVRPVVGDRDRVGSADARHQGGGGVGDGDRQVGWQNQRVGVGGGIVGGIGVDRPRQRGHRDGVD